MLAQTMNFLHLLGFLCCYTFWAFCVVTVTDVFHASKIEVLDFLHLLGFLCSYTFWAFCVVTVTDVFHASKIEVLVLWEITVETNVKNQCIEWSIFMETSIVSEQGFFLIFCRGVVCP